MNVSKTEVKRANLNSYYFRKAYDNDAKVVYVNSFMPSEIFLTMGLVPFNLGAIGGILAQGRVAPNCINIAQQNEYSSDLCSTARCIMGAALRNSLPTPDFAVITSGPCDVGSHLYYILSKMYQNNWFLLDMPYYYYDQEEAIAYVENQIKNMVAVIEETLKLRLEPDKLKYAIDYSNEAALYMQKASKLAKMVPSPLSVMETIEIVATFHLLGSQEMAELCRERYEELYKQVQNDGHKSSRKPRILWHGLMPFYSNEIFTYLQDKCNLEIISEVDIYEVASYFGDYLDPNEPYRSMAKRLVSLAYNYSSINEHFIEQMSQKIEDYSIDGVISYNSRGCRHILSLSQMYRDIVNSIDRPFLELDGDYLDDRNYSFEQIKTRIDAFAELLYGRQKSDYCGN